MFLASGSAAAQGAPPPQPAQPYPYYPPAPPGAYPPAAYPPGSYPPGTYPPGAYPQYPGGYATPYAYAPPKPVKLAYHEGQAPPPGYHLEENPRKGLVIAGAVVLGVTYGLSASIGLAAQNTDYRWLAIPVFGPFIALGARNECNSNNFGCEGIDTVVRFYLVLDGIAQLGGAAMLISGVAFRKKELVSDTYYGRTEHGPRIATWSLTPDVMPGSRYGLVLRGAIF